MDDAFDTAVVSRSISLSLPATGAHTESPATRRLSSRSTDSPNGISLPASDPSSLNPSGSSSEESTPAASNSSLPQANDAAPTGSSDLKPAPSMPIKNPASSPPEEKPASSVGGQSQVSASRAPAPSLAETSRLSDPPPASTRTSIVVHPISPTPSRSPTGLSSPPASSTNTPPPTSRAPTRPANASSSTSGPARIGGAIQLSSTTPRSKITRTITDEPESTFSRPVSVTLTDPTNGQTSVSAPPFVTVLSTSTEADGSFVTFTHVIANPTGLGANDNAVRNQSVLSNRGSAAGIFISVGIAAAIITAVIFFLCRRRQRRLRRERWLAGIQRPRPLSDADPFNDPPMSSVTVLADNVTRSANGRNMLDDELRSSVSSSRPIVSHPQQLQLSGAAGRGAHGQGILDPFENEASHPHTNIGLAITSDRYTELRRQSRVSLAPSSPSMYPASLAASERSYEQESSNAHLYPNVAAPLPIQAAPAPPPPLQIPIPAARRHPPPQVPPRSLSRPKSAKLSDYNPVTPTSTTPPSSVSSHSKPNTPTDSESSSTLVHIWDQHTAPSHEITNQMYAKGPVDVLTRRTLLDVRPRFNRDIFGGTLS